MYNVTVPFVWNFDLSPIAIFQFSIDLARLNDESNDMSEFPVFIINLKSGELLGVSQEIATGDAYLYENSASWIVEGQGWWIGYNESEGQDYQQFSDSTIFESVKNLLEVNNGFKDIVNSVCDLARNKDLHDLKMDGLYQKYISNEDSPSL